MSSTGNNPISGLRDLFLGAESARRPASDATPEPDASTPVVPARPRPSRPARPASSVQPERQSKPSSRKTSLNLPISLLERLEATRLEERWTLPDLLRRGIEHPPSQRVAEEIWRAHRGQRASPRGLALDSQVDAALDTFSKEWRMSRSQVAAAVLSHTLVGIEGSGPRES
jgi:hypothetical protein